MYIVPPIIVFPAAATDFSTNGIRLLSPLSAEHDLTFNQAGEVEITHPLDDDGDWKTLQGNMILKCPVRRRGELHWQPFRIYDVQTILSESGEMSVKVKARHIFYDLNEVLLIDVRPVSKNGQNAIQWIFDHTLTAV